MSSFLKQRAKARGGFQIKPRGAGCNDRLKEVLNRNRLERAMSVDPPSKSHKSGSASVSVTHQQDRKSCPNSRCPNPSAPVSDGFCSACGYEVESSNIVAEIQFGETSSGQAVVHGSYVGADQGATRTVGPGMRRMGGDNREKTIREARNMMYGIKARLKGISEGAIDAGILIFKLALSENWLQGRGLDKVVPVCLYTACRREDRCDVMLIDFAELVRVNVYELGHVFKDLNNIYSFQNNNVRSIIPEDLMMRFAEKLEFGDLTNKVAADATRLCRRMGRDWMVMGRRPSGICGACLLMAARMWNFRRTVKEVVYVVKVTTVTIEQRLDEFTVTESSELSIEDFLNQEFLESRHDPPAFYKQSVEWEEKMEKAREVSGRKRRRVLPDIDGEEETEATPAPTCEGTPTPAESTATPKPPASTVDMPPPPIPRPPPDISKLRQVTEFLPRSFDRDERREFVEPFDPDQVPKRAPKATNDAEISQGLNADNPNSDEAMDDLAETYGNSPERENGEESATTGKRKRGRQPVEPLLTFDEEWERDETELENQINEVINDPHSDAHQKALATAAHLAHIKAEWARSQLPRAAPLKMDEVIGEDEFADDPEVQFCMLGPEEVRIKEDIWINSNKDWIRKQQDKEYRKQMEALGPPKRRRNRVKRPRIGEGQLTPASSPGEAAVEALKKRNTVSKRINYDAITRLFSNSGKKGGPGSVVSRLGSETASRTSRAGSMAEEGRVESSPRDKVRPSQATPTATKTTPPAEAPAEAENEEVEEEEVEEEQAQYDDDDGDVEEPTTVIYNNYEPEELEHPGYGEDDYDDGDEDY